MTPIGVTELKKLLEVLLNHGPAKAGPAMFGGDQGFCLLVSTQLDVAHGSAVLGWARYLRHVLRGIREATIIPEHVEGGTRPCPGR